MTRRKQRALDYTTVGVAVLMTIGVLLGAVRCAHAQSTFYDAHGRVSGTSSTYGDTTTYRDAQGRTSGTATTSGDLTTFRDRMGRDAGSAVSSSNGTTYYDSMGRVRR